MEPPPAPWVLTELSSMNFKADELVDVQLFHTLNILDCCNRQGLGIEIDVSQPEERAFQALTLNIDWRGVPGRIRVHNGRYAHAEAVNHPRPKANVPMDRGWSCTNDT